MRPDPLALRASATALAAAGADLRDQVVRTDAALARVAWAAPYVDQLRALLAASSAQSREGARGLEAAAAHLRLLATRVEQAHQEALALHDDAVDRARELSLLPLDPGAGAGPVPPPDDPRWLEATGLRLPPPPPVPRVAPAAVPPSPPGLVAADPADVRGVTVLCALTAGACDQAVAGGRSRVDLALVDGGLGDGGLGSGPADPLGGGLSAQWLRSLTTAGSALGRASGSWREAGRRASLLAELLGRADAGTLLADPRLALVVATLEALPHGGDAVQAALSGCSDADIRWVGRVLPQAAGSLPPHSFWARYRDGLLHPSLPDWQSLVSAAGLVLRDAAEWARSQLGDAVSELRRLRLGLAQLSGAALAQGRTEALAAARRVLSWRALVHRVEGLAERSRVLPLLARLDEPPLSLPSWLPGLLRGAATPLSVVSTALGVVWDVRDGMPPAEALLKGVAGLAAGLLTAEAATTLLAPAVVALAVVLLPEELAVVAVVAGFLAVAALAWAAGSLAGAVVTTVWSGVSGWVRGPHHWPWHRRRDRAPAAPRPVVPVWS